MLWIRPGLLAQTLVAVQELLVGESVGEAGAAHAHILQQAEIEHLVFDLVVVEGVGGFEFVGFYAAHIKWVLLKESEQWVRISNKFG